METNILYYGDNLDIMHQHIPDNSIDLIYIDPPFFSSKAYEVIFGDAKERRMFEDRWKGRVTFYVDWMIPRLTQMQRILTPTGSIYVHLDWHAAHYIKVAMDNIFGYDNFLNDIVWHYKRWPAKQKSFQRMHDVILFYSKVYRQNKFNISLERLSEGTIKRWRGKKSKVEYEGNIRLVTKMTNEDSLGRPLDDVWDIPVINSQAKERLGYPTQKPENLLKRIIEASSDPNDIVADFFCGCGTTVAVAQQLGRRWVGCDVSPTALRLVKQRLVKYGATDIKEIGVPKSLEELKAMKPFEFQNYVVDFIQGVHNPKLTSEGGVDGWTVFKHHPIQIKQQEHVGRPEIQKFESAIRRERRDTGYIFAFSFSRLAYEETARCRQQDNINIELVEVMEMMSRESPPSFS